MIRAFQIPQMVSVAIGNVAGWDTISWNQALEAGLTPKDYSFRAVDIPEDSYQATLDFKIWADKVTGISCYFTKADSGEKMLLIFYRDRTTREYVLGDTDFRDSPIEAL